MDPETRRKVDAAAKRRGLTTGALLRSLAVEAAERDKAAERLLRQLEELDPDDASDAP